MNTLLALRLDTPLVVVAAWTLILVLAVLVVAVPTRHRDGRRRAVRFAVLVGLGVGVLVVVGSIIVLDVVRLFGDAPVSWGVRASIAGGAAVAVAALVVLAAPLRWRLGALRRSAAGVLAVVALVDGALGVNAAYGSIRTLEQLFPIPIADPTEGGIFPAKLDSATHPIAEADWTAPADLPSVGTIVQANIAATVSGFPARPATIYLPPAALVAAPPILPVVVILSGQPGDTTDIFTSGQFQDVLDAYAAAHAGLAPIVVSPDQLGSPDNNPMCIDSSLGNSRTYLEIDVPTWINQHLNVATDRTAWTFGGFSQGGTCTFQVGLDRPDVFATNLEIAGELTPTLGGDGPATLRQVFGGDQAAYDAISPLGVMQQHAPYADTTLLMAVGEQDTLFAAFDAQLAAGACAAGLDVQQYVVPGTSHDFYTVHTALDHYLPTIMQRSGVTS